MIPQEEKSLHGIGNGGNARNVRISVTGLLVGVTSVTPVTIVTSVRSVTPVTTTTIVTSVITIYKRDVSPLVCSFDLSILGHIKEALSDGA
jgi:hypothetical protein